MALVTDYVPHTNPSLWALTLLVVSYILGLAVYRLYFSPLASIPGPRLAALTLWYEFYHDFFRKGKFLWVIADMHEQYGKSFRTLL